MARPVAAFHLLDVRCSMLVVRCFPKIKMVNPSINEREPRIERLQLIALAALMIIGAMFVYSAMQASTSASLPWYSQNWVRQIVWYVLGIGVATALCVVDYHTIARWSLV